MEEERIDEEEILKNLKKCISMGKQYRAHGEVGSCISCFQSDEMKMKMLTKYENQLTINDIFEVILSLSSKEQQWSLVEKYKALWSRSDLSAKAYISELINQLPSDELKIEKLHQYSSQCSIFMVIKGLDNDNLKKQEIERYRLNLLDSDIEKLKKTFHHSESEAIIAEDAVIENLEKNFENMSNEDILNILKGLSSDEVKLEEATKLKHLFNKDECYEISCFLETDAYKEALLDIFQSKLTSTYIQMIICGMSQDERKIKVLEEKSAKFNYTHLVKIINSFSNDALKVKMIEKYQDVFNNSEFTSDCYAKMISRISDDAIKMKEWELYRDKLRFSDYDSVISSFSSDEIKTQELEKVSDKISKDYSFKTALMSIHDDELKVKTLEKYYDKLSLNAIVQVTQSIQNDDEKIRIFRRYADELFSDSLVRFIASVRDDEKKVALLEEYESRLDDDISLVGPISSFR